MKQPHSYRHCYSVLDADENYSWHDLRKSYRTLIQKWHPDKYQDEKEKSYATDKLKELNIAYKQLSDHHSKHGALPQTTPPPQQSTAVSPSFNKEKLSNHKTAKRKTTTKAVLKNKKKTTLRHIFTYSTISIIIIIIYQGINSTSTSTQVSLSGTEKPTLKKKKILQNKQSKKREIQTKSKIKYFTYGSTLGEVIMIQGPPDRIVKDIWYYGSSEIHFKDGMVKKWLRTANNPLKAQAILIPDNKTLNTGFR